MPAVSVRGVSKKYRIFPSGRDRLREALSFGRKKYGRDFWALENVNLEVEAGTALGILGRNGAGKSTLLSIIAGIIQPTSGTVEVNGRMVALFALGAGFNKEFTGRENVMLNGLILGVDRREILERFDDIAAFADIGEYMDQPIKSYSSGMRQRLGFAVAVNIDPDVMIVDEALAVGDAVFKQKAMQRMHDLRDSGTAILFVSHNLETVKEFCTEAVLIHKGRVLAAGGVDEVADSYEDLVTSIKTQKKNNSETGRDRTSDRSAVTSEREEGPKDPASGDAPGPERRAVRLRSGPGEVRVRGVELLDEHLHPTESVASGSTMTVRARVDYPEAAGESDLVVTLRNESGLEMLSASTDREGAGLGEVKGGERVAVDFIFEVPLQPGSYTVTAATTRPGSDDLRVDRAGTAKVEITPPPDRHSFRGIVRLPIEIKVHAPEGGRRGRSA